MCSVNSIYEKIIDFLHKSCYNGTTRNVKMKGDTKMFGENLKSLRKKSGYTQQEFASVLGISASAVGMYEQGRREPDQKLLLKMAQTLGVSVDRLLGEEINEMELGEMIESVIDRMMVEYTLTHNGKRLGKEDMQSVAKAIRLGVEFAALDIENND